MGGLRRLAGVTLAALAVTWAAQARAAGEAVEIRAETVAGISEVLAPYQDRSAGRSAPATQRALEALRKEGLLTPPRPRAKDPLGERLGRALQLGNRSGSFLPELARIHDALVSGSDRAVRETIVDLWRKAGRAAPVGPALDKLVADARAARAPSTSQHVTISRETYDVHLDHSPSAGTTSVAVVTKPTVGSPERVVFSGRQVTRPRSDGTDLEVVTKPDPPRLVTEAEASAEAPSIDGTWKDQEGLKWEIARAGSELTATQVNANGHRVAYKSRWSLGQLAGTHYVDDVADMDDSLPSDVRAELASTRHPPFFVKLEYLPKEDVLRGIWISGQVTYGAMFHNITVVEDPTWDKPLVLSRGGAESALGGRLPEEGP